ncbi:hypothetical protein BJ508DRAFT_419650 [Ascobolus immersus RN42]|uniref:Pre-mRNA-splicing factor CWC26 n=1 Tax=Ascobolus immersus RN42 TaxID=1160509 RepID=A0A3N4HG48_ASCIM|nr:hypothetical protein BJ508DRAFT_419650 [Ascobolus immersus RN42]
MSLASYLAKNYLNADPAPEQKKKKRKTKHKKDDNVLIADDDALGWEPSKPDVASDSDEDRVVTVGGVSSEFKKTKTSGWKKVGADEAGGGIIGVSATKKQDEPQEEAPVREETPEDERPQVLMSSGALPGLQTAQAVADSINAKRAAELAAFAKMDKSKTGKDTETIYRDASGRIISVAMMRAEARKKHEAEEEAKRQASESLKGAVQIREREERVKALDEAKYMPFSRYADDKELNEELKQRDRWEDPALGFIETKKEKVSKTGKPLYQGAAMPNRYGIRPGHRWDGVDRGNGFEKRWFAARNAKRDREQMVHNWQYDE